MSAENFHRMDFKLAFFSGCFWYSTFLTTPPWPVIWAATSRNEYIFRFVFWYSPRSPSSAGGWGQWACFLWCRRVGRMETGSPLLRFIAVFAHSLASIPIPMLINCGEAWNSRPLISNQTTLISGPPAKAHPWEGGWLNTTIGPTHFSHLSIPN